MKTRRRSIASLLAFAVIGTLLVSCDSDDPAETSRVNGRYVAEVDVRQNATAPGADARSAGGCCFTLDLTLSTDAGDISGAGTVEYYNEDGTEAAPPRDVDVTGTAEGDAVAMSFDLGEVAVLYEFEGTVSQDGDTISGTFVGQVLDGVGVVFERVP